MTAPIGTDYFTTKESFQSEKFHTLLIKEVFDDMQKKDPNWSIKHSVSLEELMGRPCKWALDSRTKKSLVYEADGGWIFYKNQIVGVAENKYQSNVTNAIERTHRYRGFILNQNLFVSINAPIRSAVAKVVETLDFFGVFLVVNVTDKDVFRQKVVEWFDVMKKSVVDK